MPRFLKTFVLGYMAPVLCIHIDGSSKQYRHQQVVSTPGQEHAFIRPATRMSIENRNQYYNNRHVQQLSNGSAILKPTDSIPLSQEPLQMEDSFNHPFLDTFERQFLRVLNKVYQTIERNETRLSQQDLKDSLCLEWQEVALVLDRFLLLIFLAATIFFTCYIFFTAPHARLK